MTSSPKLSRRSEVSPFLAMDALREAKELERAGRRIIHMELGEPGAPTPQAIRQAGVSALSRGQLGYGEALGHFVLREEIAAFYEKKYCVKIPPDRIVITTGSSGAFLLTLIAGFDPGARIAVTQPGYPAYTNILTALGLKTAHLRLSFENNFMPTAPLLAALHKEEKLQGALLMNPANPTGTMISNEALADICRFCELENITFISDEIYHGLEYEKQAQSALCFSENAIIVNSFSKYYAMTGWRLGWIVAPATWVRALERLQQSFAICPPTLSQTAAFAAFSVHYLQNHEYNDRLSNIFQGLNEVSELYRCSVLHVVDLLWLLLSEQYPIKCRVRKIQAKHSPLSLQLQQDAFHHPNRLSLRAVSHGFQI